MQVAVGGSPATVVSSAGSPVFAQLVQNGANVGFQNALPVIQGAVTSNLLGSGSASAPTAGTAFASIANVPAGWYRISVLYGITGAAEPANTGRNVRLSLATGGSIVDLPSASGVTAVYSFAIEAYLSNTANDTIRLTAIAAATASTVYAGVINLYRLA